MSGVEYTALARSLDIRLQNAIRERDEARAEAERLRAAMARARDAACCIEPVDILCDALARGDGGA